MEDTQLSVAQGPNFEDFAMSAETIQRQVNTIQEVMNQVMKSGEHYGTIPGCGAKPTLLKPGAEKLGLTFRLAPSYRISKTDLGSGHREYEITCTLTHIGSGMVIGQGVGSCSTMEGKYRFRKAGQKCPTCGKEDTIIKGKQEYGGGWICFSKKGGCGAKFSDGDPQIENQNMGRIEHDNPADYYNTVLKMGKKRAQVDAILTATAASDIFTQDIEDMPEVFQGGRQQTPNQQNSTPPATGQTPREKMFNALTSEGLSKNEIKTFAEHLKKMDESGTITPKTMLDVSKKPTAYVREWHEQVAADQAENSIDVEDPDAWMNED